MEDVTMPLALAAFSLLLLAQMLLPRAPKALHMLLALSAVLAGLAALFWPIYVPIGRDLARALGMGIGIGAVSSA